jgi:hypothetical protein
MTRALSYVLAGLISTHAASARAQPKPGASTEIVVLDPAYQPPPSPAPWARRAVLLPWEAEHMQRTRRRARIFWGVMGIGGAMLVTGMFGSGFTNFDPSASDRRVATFAGLAALGGLTVYSTNLAATVVALRQAHWVERRGCGRASRWRGALAVAMAALPGPWSLFAPFPAARQLRTNERWLEACRTPGG